MFALLPASSIIGESGLATRIASTLTSSHLRSVHFRIQEACGLIASLSIWSQITEDGQIETDRLMPVMVYIHGGGYNTGLDENGNCDIFFQNLTEICREKLPIYDGIGTSQ